MSQPNERIEVQALLVRFTQIFVPVVLILSGILYSVIRFDQHIRLQRAEVREHSRILVAKQSIQSDFASVITDLQVLSNLPLLQSYLSDGQPAQRADLEKIFLLLAKKSRRYDQIRYLDATGEERIRINDNDGMPAVVTAAKLQNKRGRYYFEDSLALNRNQIFVSPLDLNMEHRRIETPYKPMIRFGTPVYDRNGDKKGVVILNYFGDRLLKNFHTTMQGGLPHEGMLLNQEGYWLSGPNPTKEWGFMFGDKSRTFAHEYPDIWPVIRASEQGFLRTDRGLFVYDTVRPLSTLGPIEEARATASQASSPPYQWKIVSFIPDSALYASAFYTHTFSWAILALTFLMLALLTLYIARVTLSRQLARQSIRRLNKELEKRVIAHAAGEERLSVTLNAIGDAVLSTDKEGNVNRLNPVAEKLTGWSQADAYGRPIGEVFNIINQQTRAPAPVPVWNTLNMGSIQGLANDTVLIARDGTERPIADSCAPIRDRQGAIIGAILVFRDVTQEYAAKRALIDSRKRIQEILNAVADGVVTIDQHGAIESFNPAAEQLFGYTEAEVMGQNVKMLMPEPHRSQHDDYLARYLETGEARVVGQRREMEAQRKNGSRFPINLAVNTLQLSDAVHFTGVIRDITETKLHEQQLIAARDDAEKANHLKDSFLATMSHEIRTPLTGILGMLEVLSMTDLEPDQITTLQAAWESARGLLRIVNDILDWSKIQEGKLVLSPQATSIPQLIQEVVNTYSRVASAKNLLLKHEIDPKLSAAHIVDPLRLSQILNNFVSNAIKFTEEGEIVVSAELLELKESGERIRFSVRDTGVGIAEEVQAQLFQHYRQASADTARLYGGTGLGLSICRRLADLLDGQIQLVSAPNEGATFSLILTLPVSAAPADRLPALLPVVEQRKVTPFRENTDNAPQVLAVDDHPINRDLLARQIRLLGLRVVSADNGISALAAWPKDDCALIITDCHMPELDGYAFARAVRKIETEEKRPRLPIIAWTANASSEELERCQASGIDDLLVKPADLTQLKQAIARWLPVSDAENDKKTTPLGEATDESDQERILDSSVLANIVQTDAERVRLLQEFHRHILADATRLADELKTGAQAETSLISVADAAHRMKGSSRMVGAQELAEACQRIEETARANDHTAACAAESDLTAALDRFGRMLAERTRNQGS
ncbi:hypothetical protein A9404_01935 [Halothiobacillus diazotrophicus]|uniref:Sensor protein FixL n=1 Tax=Halothiobacillus diazotrophicus TaxID=1860122 RepID=A0A191ZEL0_9GAMM|nr:PAS domain S-box protein [Halothiobacillus diazotrophicus]ANJ66302.1 hypothetical protein A9404_01935 [Halothiobacillus diazotrophicus]